MLAGSGLESKVTTSHLAKRAYVYIRQSSLEQVTRHPESTDVQYRLVERAVQLGWPRASVQVIDEDLGKSGSSAVERSGFQNLIAAIGLGLAGLVLSFDASRLARNNGDWYRLLELCSVFGTLIADSERVYDPGVYTDRLLLGLSGMMSEAELHQLKRRLNTGAWNKAGRGELRQSLPVGMVRQPDGAVILHPDEEVQARIRLVFEKFQEFKVAKAVVRYFREKGLWLPSRPLRGPAPHTVIWQPARSSMVLAILKNPVYAGTYVYGRQTRDATRYQAGHPHSGIVRRPIDSWPIVIHHVYPAYITWETFLANQSQLAANQSRYHEERPGTPKKGQGLLQGMVRCGRCGARMRLRYSGPQGDFPVYGCYYAHHEYDAPACQSVRGLELDAQVERLVLEALAPDQLELALAALEALEKEYQALRRQRELHLERLRYEAERARRQYDAVEPENRLVARALEGQWEASLQALAAGEQEYRSWLEQERLQLTAADRQDILCLATDLPQVWHAPSTTAADRKQIVRFLIREVIVDAQRAPGQVWFQINWQTEAVSEHGYKRRVPSYAAHADLAAIRQRVEQLHAEHKLDAEIAQALRAEGFLTTKGQPFNSRAIWFLRKQWGLPAVIPNGPHPPRWEDGSYSVEGVAEAIGVFPGTIYRWLKVGRLVGRQLQKGSPWQVLLTPEDINALKDHVRRVRRSRKAA